MFYDIREFESHSFRQRNLPAPLPVGNHMTVQKSNSPDPTEIAQWLQVQAHMLADLLARGQFAQGEAQLSPILASYPGWGFGWKLQAGFLTSMARFEPAMQAIRNAIGLLGDDAELFNMAGIVFRETGQIENAVACLRKSCELDPKSPEAQNNLGGALMMQTDVNAATNSFRRAVELSPDYPEAWQNLGNALLVQNQSSDAIRCHLRAVNLQPMRQQALSMACLAMLQSAMWSDFEERVGQLQANLGRAGFQAPIPFVFNGLPGSTRQEHLRCAQQFAQEQYGGFLNQAPLCNTPMSAQGRLRIGYLSADFHEHATAYLLAGVLDCHDRTQFEIYGYSYGPTAPNEMRHRLTQSMDVFRDICKLSHQQAAHQIAADAIDILVDLKGFTEHARPPIVALRPAPVIVNWLGHPSTMGHRRLADYLIGDPVVTPLEHQADYSETLALLPDSYQPTDGARQMAPRPSRAAAGLPDAGLIFASFNQVYKLTPGVFDSWCRVLLAVPGSVLWLLEATPQAMDNLRSQAAARGLAPERLIFAPKLPQSDHLARLQLADIALDTFPYTSHTTGSDALWAGVPMVTRMGDSFGARVAASLLTAVGQADLITNTPEDYEALVLALAQDADRRARIRTHLGAHRATLPLFDTSRFTRHLEALFQQIRQQSIHGEKRPFVVTPLADGALP